SGPGPPPLLPVGPGHRKANWQLPRKPGGLCRATEFSSDARLVLEDLNEGNLPQNQEIVGVRLREVPSGKEVFRLRHPGPTCDLQALAPDGRMVLTGSSQQEKVGDELRYRGTFTLWEVAT